MLPGPSTAARLAMCSYWISSATACAAVTCCKWIPTTPETNPVLVMSMTALIAVPVAPTTCGLNAIFNWLTSVEQGTRVSSEHEYEVNCLYVNKPFLMS